MNDRPFRYEGWLYGLAFLLALGLRLTALGAMPLNDAEARLALDALQITQGFKPVLDPHPAYILFTAPLFFLYGGGTNFLARLIPALVGSLLVFAPLLFLNRLKPRPALILAFFMALDPGLTAISRQAGSPILAVACLVSFLGFLNLQKPRLAGSLGALALLAGPPAWHGLVGILIAWMIFRGLQTRLPNSDPATAGDIVPFDLQVAGREALISFGLTFVAGGTLFFLVPNGLSAALGSIPTYTFGWISPSNVRAGWMLISLLAYQPFAILLCVLALLRGWTGGDRRVIALSVWFVAALLLAIFYPSKQVADLAWALIPLWTMAAMELVHYLEVEPQERNEAVGATLLTTFLWLFGWLNYSTLVWMSYGAPGYGMRLGLVIGSFALLLFSLLLVAFGWSVRVAQLGAVWGLGISLGALGLSGTFGSMGVRGMFKPELWWQLNVPRQAQLLETTIDDLSEWSRGYDHALPVVIYGVDSPALLWTLREHQPMVVEALDFTSSPELVITDYAGDPTLAASYRGQDFTWRLATSWEVALPGDWHRWLAYREMTQTGENIVLWAREDLFLGSSPPPTP